MSRRFTQSRRFKPVNDDAGSGRRRPRWPVPDDGNGKPKQSGSTALPDFPYPQEVSDDEALDLGRRLLALLRPKPSTPLPDPPKLPDPPTLANPPRQRLVITRREAAEALSCDYRTVDDLVRSRKLSAVRCGSRVMILVSALEKFLGEPITLGPRPVRGNAKAARETVTGD
jgi:excisionase family DNA binding protein